MRVIDRSASPTFPRIWLLLMLVVLLAVASSAESASASPLPVSAERVSAQTISAAMCDRNVTISSVEVVGVTVSVTVSDISTACFGWTLKVQVTDDTNAPVNSELTTVVDQTSEMFVSLNIGNVLGTNRYYFAFQQLP